MYKFKVASDKQQAQDKNKNSKKLLTIARHYQLLAIDKLKGNFDFYLSPVTLLTHVICPAVE